MSRYIKAILLLIYFLKGISQSANADQLLYAAFAPSLCASVDLQRIPSNKTISLKMVPIRSADELFAGGWERRVAALFFYGDCQVSRRLLRDNPWQGSRTVKYLVETEHCHHASPFANAVVVPWHTGHSSNRNEFYREPFLNKSSVLRCRCHAQSFLGSLVATAHRVQGSRWIYLSPSERQSLWDQKIASGQLTQGFLASMRVSRCHEPTLLPDNTAVHKGHLVPLQSVGFGGKLLTVAMDRVEDYPWQGKDQSGITFTLIRELSRRLNFVYNVKYFNCTLEPLRLKQADFAAVAVSPTDNLSMVLGLTVPFGYRGYSFMVASSGSSPLNTVLVQPFTPLVWAFIALSVVIVSGLFCFIHMVCGWRDKPIHQCLFFVYCSFVRQGCRWHVEGVSARILFISWLAAVVIIEGIYTGKLVSLFATQRTQTPQTISELFQSSPAYAWGYVGTERTRSKLSHQVTVYEALDEKVLRMVRDQRKVIIGPTELLRSAISRSFTATGRCEYVVGEDFMEESVSLATPLDSPYLDRLNKAINAVTRAGLTAHWKYSAFNVSRVCGQKLRDGTLFSTGVIDRERMTIIFIILTIGILVALLAFFLEVLLDKAYPKMKPCRTDPCKN